MHLRFKLPFHCITWLSLVLACEIKAEEIPAGIRDLNTPRKFVTVHSQKEWQEHAKIIREQILVSAGLWPLPEKTPLNAKIFGKIEREGYSIEKVYFQTYPGFYLAGNIYRPLGKGPGPFPAILNPHGHWSNGRLADAADGSIAARCINFAKRGMIAFSYDMVGYNDTHFPESFSTTDFYSVHRNFATNDPSNLLWSISLMGLQTWNSIRALDLLESLPDVDKKRLACTGASGGGTQTFILGAIDDRLATQAPVVMVSHTMQGGCGCENMPGLRVEYSNMEIAAAASPRPQIIVGASGDWTKSTLTVEGPAIAQIYRLFNAADKLRFVRFDFNHNYNQTSREAVYQWFDNWLLGTPDNPAKELLYTKEPDEDLKVFPDGKLPSDAVTQEKLIKFLKESHQSTLDNLLPEDAAGLKQYKEIMEPAWMRTLQLDSQGAASQCEMTSISKRNGYQVQEFHLKREREDRHLDLVCFSSLKAPVGKPKAIVLIANDARTPDCLDKDGAPVGLAKQLLVRDYSVAFIKEIPSTDYRDQFSIFYSTYNRTYLQERVRDLVSACHSLKSIHPTKTSIVLCGTGRAGLWSLLAAPAANAVIADCSQLDLEDDAELLKPDLFCPGIRNINTFIGASILAAPNPLVLHNLSPRFDILPLQKAYKSLKRNGSFTSQSVKVTESEIANWIFHLDQLK